MSNPPPLDRRRQRALSLLETCKDFASLSIPASAAHRDRVLAGAALTGALTNLLDVAQGVDPVRAFCIVLVQRAAEAGLDYAQTAEGLMNAVTQAAEAHAATLGAAQAAGVANAHDGKGSG